MFETELLGCPQPPERWPSSAPIGPRLKNGGFSRDRRSGPKRPKKPRALKARRGRSARGARGGGGTYRGWLTLFRKIASLARKGKASSDFRNHGFKGVKKGWKTGFAGRR